MGHGPCPLLAVVLPGSAPVGTPPPKCQCAWRGAQAGDCVSNATPQWHLPVTSEQGSCLTAVGQGCDTVPGSRHQKVGNEKRLASHALMLTRDP